MSAWSSPQLRLCLGASRRAVAALVSDDEVFVGSCRTAEICLFCSSNFFFLSSTVITIFLRLKMITKQPEPTLCIF